LSGRENQAKVFTRSTESLSRKDIPNGSNSCCCNRFRPGGHPDGRGGGLHPDHQELWVNTGKVHEKEGDLGAVAVTKEYTDSIKIQGENGAKGGRIVVMVMRKG
jgi:hypothetical protein